MRTKMLIAALAGITLAASSLPAADLRFDNAAAAKFVSANGYQTPAPPKAFDYTTFIRELEQGTTDAKGKQVRPGEGRVSHLYDDASGNRLRDGATAKGNATIGVGHLVTGRDDPMIAKVIEADVRGTNPKWTNAQVKADVTARMTKVMDGTAELSNAQVDKLARMDIDVRLDQMRKDAPNFDQLPGNVQAALMDLKYRGDIRNPNDERVGEALAKGDMGKVNTILAERSRKDTSYNDKNLPGVKTRVDYNRKVLSDYWTDQTADALWTRAIQINARIVKFPDPDGSTMTADMAQKRTLEALAILDEENLRRFQAARFLTFLPFSFSTPISTGGLTDLFVPANTNFVFRIYDSGVEDGDTITVSVADASRPGGRTLGTYTLTNAGRSLTEFVRAGPVEIRVRAENEGTLSPNTGGLQVTSPVISGNGSQIYNLNTGQTGTLRVVAQ